MRRAVAAAGGGEPLSGVALRGWLDDAPDAGQDLLAGAVPLGARLTARIAATPGASAAAISAMDGGGGLLAIALKKVTMAGPLSLLSSLEKSGNYGAGAHGLSQVLDYQKTWLAEHHIYGSSRLGLQQYWGDRYAWLWTGGQTAAQNGAAWTGSQLAMARPWYSRGFEGMVSAGQTSAWGNGNSSQILSARLLGTRRYELTDHLGDVAAVVADKPVDAADPDHAGLILRRAALTAAYDHYPFGMLMPGRYVEDATGQCTPVTVSRTAVSYQEMGTLGVVRTPWDGSVAGLTAGRSPAGGGQVMPDEDWVIAPGNPVVLDAARVYNMVGKVENGDDAGLWEAYSSSRDMPQVFGDVADLKGWLGEMGMIDRDGEWWRRHELSAGTLAEMDSLTLEKGAATGDGYVWPVLSAGAQGVAGAPYRVQVGINKEGLEGDWELQLWDSDSTGAMRLLNAAAVYGDGMNEIEGISLSGSNVVAALTYVGGGDRRKMAKVGIARDGDGVAGVKAGYPVWVTTTETVLSCSGDGFGGDYRFGFNGQMKVNEIAGIGNYYNFGARMYDARLCRFPTPDPLRQKFPGQSPYLFAGNNPIVYVDEEGKAKTLYINIIDERTNGLTQIKLTGPGLMPVQRPGKAEPAMSELMAGFATWDWHDYSQSMNIKIDKNGSYNFSPVSAPEIGDWRTNTFFKYEDQALNNVGEYDFDKGKVADNRRFGGWIGTSKYGGGEDNKFNPKAGDGSVFVDYGSIMKAFAGTGAAQQPFSIGMGALKAALLRNDKAANPLQILQKLGMGAHNHGDEVECPSCHDKSDSSHIDVVNGKGTYDSIINSPAPQTGGRR